MTGKQLLFNALQGEKTSRPAWVPFVGVHGGQLIGVGAEEYLKSADRILEGLRKSRELYKPDGLPIAFDLQMEAEVLGCELNWVDDGPPSVISHPLEMGGTLVDLKGFDLSAGRLPLVAKATRSAKAEMGDEVALYGLITGPFTLALHLMGNMIFLEMFDSPDKVKEVLSFCEEVGRRMVDLYVDAGADVVAVVDPMTSQISPGHFEQFVTPFINGVFDHTRARQAFSSIFVCGDATRNLEVMARTSCDNISVDENIDLAALCEVARKHGKSVGGNLKLTLALLLGTADDCRRDAIRCIDTCGGEGFVLAPGCDLPWGVPEENLIAVTEMVHDDYKRDVARTTLKASEAEGFDDVQLPNYDEEKAVIVDVITLDSTSCAPCQYMMDAALKAAGKVGDVVVREHKVKNHDGIGHMIKLGVANIPTICIDGKPEFVSIIPDQPSLVSAIENSLKAKA